MPYGFVSHVFIEILPLVNPRVSFLLGHFSQKVAMNTQQMEICHELPGFPMDFQRISNGFPGSPWMWQGNAGPRSIDRLGDRNEIRASGVQVRCPAEGDFEALDQLVPFRTIKHGVKIRHRIL